MAIISSPDLSSHKLTRLDQVTRWSKDLLIHWRHWKIHCSRRSDSGGATRKDARSAKSGESIKGEGLWRRGFARLFASLAHYWSERLAKYLISCRITNSTRFKKAPHKLTCCVCVTQHKKMIYELCYAKHLLSRPLISFPFLNNLIFESIENKTNYAAPDINRNFVGKNPTTVCQTTRWRLIEVLDPSCRQVMSNYRERLPGISASLLTKCKLTAMSRYFNFSHFFRCTKSPSNRRRPGIK